MPKVERRKARKDYPSDGIKKGDTYFTWSFNFGPTKRSLNYPKQSQLTMSEFLSEFYSIGEDLETSLNGAGSPEDLQSAVEEAVERIETLRDETQEKHDNMPEGLQQGDTGQLLEDRVNNLEEWLNDLENIDLEYDEPDAAEESDIEKTDYEKEDGALDEEGFDKAVEEWQEEQLQTWISEKITEINDATPGTE